MNWVPVIQVQHEFKPERHHGRMNAWLGRQIMKGAIVAVLTLLAVPALATVATASSTAAAASAVKSPPQPAQPIPFMTLEQAVAKVEKDTHGKVLRASKRLFGNLIEYRIKVLTPDGHVRVVSVRTSKPPASKHSSKETH